MWRVLGGSWGVESTGQDRVVKERRRRYRTFATEETKEVGTETWITTEEVYVVSLYKGESLRIVGVSDIEGLIQYMDRTM